MSELKIPLVWLHHTSHPRAKCLRPRDPDFRLRDCLRRRRNLSPAVDNVLWSLFTQPRHIWPSLTRRSIISGHNCVQMIEYLSVSAKLSHLDVIRRYHNKLRRCLTRMTISPTSLKINKSSLFQCGRGEGVLQLRNQTIYLTFHRDD